MGFKAIGYNKNLQLVSDTGDIIEQKAGEGILESIDRYMKVYNEAHLKIDIIIEREIRKLMITQLDQVGIDFLKQEEGVVLHAYQDNAGVWTIGTGNTYYLNGTPVKEGDVITQEQADELFNHLLPLYEKEVIGLNLENQGQFNSLTSLCWNIGQEGFLKSSLRALVLEDPNNASMRNVEDVVEPDIKAELLKEGRIMIHEITYHFLMWRMDGGRFDIDLWHRRWREAVMYLNQ